MLLVDRDDSWFMVIVPIKLIRPSGKPGFNSPLSFPPLGTELRGPLPQEIPDKA